jgi:DNA-binding CsgD family transcriptional regulator
MTAFERPEQDRCPVASFLPRARRRSPFRPRLPGAQIERQLARGTLDWSSTATLVVSRDARVLYANREAKRLMQEGDAISILGTQLATSSNSVAERVAGLIQEAVNAAVDGSGESCGGMLAIARPNRLPLTLLIAPLRRAIDSFAGRPLGVILFLRDPEGPSPEGFALQDLFGLTAAEATIAVALANGHSIGHIAAHLRIALNTARTHTKSIYAKTGTNRQSQLVALLLRSVAVLPVSQGRHLGLGSTTAVRREKSARVG